MFLWVCAHAGTGYRQVNLRFFFFFETSFLPLEFISLARLANQYFCNLHVCPNPQH